MDRQVIEFRTVVFPYGTTALGLAIKNDSQGAIGTRAKAVSRNLGVKVGDVIVEIAGMALSSDVTVTVEAVMVLIHQASRPLPIKLRRPDLL